MPPVFSLDYLGNINTAIPKDAAVEMTLGEDLPTFFDYGFDEGNGHVPFSLAPRIVPDRDPPESFLALHRSSPGSRYPGLQSKNRVLPD